MKKILYIEASPRKKRSSSIAISHLFLDAYKQKHPQDTITSLDLWKAELPSFDGKIIDVKYAIMNNQPYSKAEAHAWQKVEAIIGEFKSADKYIISLPMWNFGIPYILKQYIDLLVQPGYTFTVSKEQGYTGLVTGRPVLLIYSRGGAYGAGSEAEAFDLQKQYMEAILKFIGFTQLHSIVIEPTLSGEEKKEQAIKAAEAQAVSLAATF